MKLTGNNHQPMRVLNYSQSLQTMFAALYLSSDYIFEVKKVKVTPGLK